jgi:hypothetical protein
MATATTEPMTASSRDKVGGIVMAKSKPVITADPSHNEWKGFLRAQRKSASVAKQAAKQETYRPTALNLKKYREAATAGKRAKITVNMILGTESLPWKWGDD